MDLQASMHGSNLPLMSVKELAEKCGEVCPVCNGKMGTFEKHMNKHYKASVIFAGVRCLPCHKECKPGANTLLKHGHYHCPVCMKISSRKEKFEHHITSCRKDATASSISKDTSPETDTIPEDTSPVPDTIPKDTSPVTDSICQTHITEHKYYTDFSPEQESTSPKKFRMTVKRETSECNICNKKMLLKNLKRHIREIHFSKSDTIKSQLQSCQVVDLKNGTYLVSKSPGGFQQPDHVQEENLEFTSVQEIKSCQEVCIDGYSSYPGNHIDEMLKYITEHKSIPKNVKPKEIDLGICSISPAETFCNYCHDDLEDQLFTTNAAIYCIDKVIEELMSTTVYQDMTILECLNQLMYLAIENHDTLVNLCIFPFLFSSFLHSLNTRIEVYVKRCNSCGIFYRYQNYDEGLHNYNNNVMLSIKLCLWLRSSCKNNTPISQTLSIIEDVTECRLPKEDIVDGYFHFEELSNHSFSYSCRNCSHRPSILIFDGASSVSVEIICMSSRFKFAQVCDSKGRKSTIATSTKDIKIVERDGNDTVSCEDLSLKVKYPMVAKGFFTGNPGLI